MRMRQAIRPQHSPEASFAVSTRRKVSWGLWIDLNLLWPKSSSPTVAAEVLPWLIQKNLQFCAAQAIRLVIALLDFLQQCWLQMASLLLYFCTAFALYTSRACCFARLLTTRLCSSARVCCAQPSHKTFRTKRTLAVKMKQNRPIPNWIRLRTDNKIRAAAALTIALCISAVIALATHCSNCNQRQTVLQPSLYNYSLVYISSDGISDALQQKNPSTNNV
eukprot:21271-Heterococcus_DN1.PRE.2